MSQIPISGSNYARDLVCRSVKKRRAGIDIRYQKFALVWAIRLLVNMGGYKQFHRAIMDEDAFFELAGIKPLERGYKPLDVKKALKGRLPILEARLPKNLGLLSENIMLMANTLDLNEIEQKVLAFAVVLNNLKWFENCCDSIGALDTTMAQDAVATALSLDKSEVRNVFSQDGALIASGIMRLQAGNMDLKAKLQVLNVFCDVLFTKHQSADELLQPFFNTAVPSSLSRTDYAAHAASEWLLVSDYLRAVEDNRLRGSNVLIHGISGSGKTAFARAVSKDLGIKLCEVSDKDMEGNPLEPNQRLGAYLLAQRALQRVRHQCILFDEVEDVFPEASIELFGTRMKGARLNGKSWMNGLLESNPVPTFWLTNSIEQIDVAHMRRFDLIIEMPKPSRSLRKNLLERYLNGLPVTDRWLSCVAENPHLTPASIERASKVIRLINPKCPSETETKLQQVLH